VRRKNHLISQSIGYHGLPDILAGRHFFQFEVISDAGSKVGRRPNTVWNAVVKAWIDLSPNNVQGRVKWEWNICV
jgi:hypothetical protein